MAAGEITVENATLRITHEPGRSLVLCPTYHRVVYCVVRGGIQVKCKACGAIHTKTRAEIEREWDALEQQTVMTEEEQIQLVGA